MERLKLFLILCCLSLTVYGQNWKSVKNVRTNALKSQQDSRSEPNLSLNRIQKYGPGKVAEGDFQRIFNQILKVRTPGSEGSRQVRQFIENELSGLGWTIEEDNFEQNTVVGKVPFSNIIATLDPNAPRRMVLACHYDSKLTPRGFLAATDSAAPCAQMINLARSMQNELEGSKGRELTLQFIFFDGEEAFRQWSDTDSLYGSRHLAAKWQREPYEYQGIRGNTLDRIDVFMLLDLLGANAPRITSSHSDTNPWFKKLMKIEVEVTKNGLVRQSVNRHRIFRQRSGLASLLGGGGIEDDHKPFERRGVPILHIISSPFPDVWHTINDNANAIHPPTVEKLNMIFRIFVAEYLELP